MPPQRASHQLGGAAVRGMRRIEREELGHGRASLVGRGAEAGDITGDITGDINSEGVSDPQAA